MANLISAADRSTYENALNDVHDTFARPITVWRKSAQTIASEEGGYDAFNDEGIKPANVTYVTSSKQIMARIKYIDRQELEFGLTVANTKIDVTQSFQLVRIKVTAADNAYITDCEKLTVDGQDFVPVTTPRPHGLFGNNYFTIYLGSNP